MKVLSGKARERLLYLISPIALIALWQVLLMLGIGDRRFIPAPSDIAQRFVKLVASGELAWHVGVTLYRVALGYVIGAVPAVAIGLLMAMFKPVRIFFDPLIAALFPIPKIALLPLLILWFGIGEPSKIATIALGVFFPTTISAYSACDSVPRNLIRMAQSFGLPPLDIVRKILLPGAMPGILAGFRISASVALLLVVAAEMIGAEYGIGAFVLTAGNLMQTDQLLAGVVMLSVLGLLIAWGLGALERRVLKWR